jgi:DHA1 family multidrug resistance protein-like MFS transporter
MGMGLSTSFLPLLASDIDPSGVLVGLVVSAFFFSRVFIEIPAGIISDRIGRRKLLIIGLCLYAIGAFLCAQASVIHILIVGRAIWGLGTASFFMTTTALMIDLFDSRARGTALGIFQGIEFIGNFIGTPIGAFLATVVSYSARVLGPLEANKQKEPICPARAIGSALKNIRK